MGRPAEVGIQRKAPAEREGYSVDVNPASAKFTGPIEMEVVAYDVQGTVIATLGVPDTSQVHREKLVDDAVTDTPYGMVKMSDLELDSVASICTGRYKVISRPRGENPYGKSDEVLNAEAMTTGPV
jgi:hypothetical protein